MRIIEIYEQFQDDFMFTAECEICGHLLLNATGKNTHEFYDKIIPAMRCHVCGLPAKGKK